MSNAPLAPQDKGPDRPKRSRSKRATPAAKGAEVTVESGEASLRELMAVREIARAFLMAERPADVYQMALERVSSIVGSSLSCVYVMDGAGGDLMRLVAAHNWPDKFAKFLGDMRVKVGAGPSGTAAGKREVVEVPDVFADTALSDWREVATELGFRSLVSLPLQTHSGVHGAVTFYYTATGGAPEEAKGLLRVVADQMAAAAEKARLIEELKSSNAALRTSAAELERQHAAVLEARRLQDEFLANLSHELRTPLTAVLGYIALMEEGMLGEVTATQRETLGQVKSSSEKLLQLIGDLLDLTSLKRSGLTVEPTSFDPRQALTDALALAGDRKDGVALVVEAMSMPVVLVSDRPKVTRLLSAVLSNAFKFTEQGEVRVSMQVMDRRLSIQVADTGVGISDDAQRFVFDEFRQEDGSATRRYGGSGLGLAIARHLARLLGGDLTLSSARGKGSTFMVDLPLIHRP